MKVFLLSLSILISAMCYGQKSYRVGRVLWEYEKPVSYRTRIDNFSSTIQSGDSVIKKNNDLKEQSNDEVILFAAAKSDSVDMNIILGTYRGNSNIANFTLKGYVDKLAEFMRSNYAQLNSDAQVSTTSAMIDNIQFYIIESKVYHKEKGFTYWTMMYVADVSGKELNVTVIYDNADDKRLIESSIMNSKFRFQ